MSLRPKTLTSRLVLLLAGMVLLGGAVTVHLPGLGDYRVAISPAQGRDRLLTGIPQTPVNHIIRDLILLEAVVLTTAVAVVAGFGAAAARRSMRPLQDLATVARQVTELPLDTAESRIPLRANEMSEPTEVAQVGQAMNAMLGHIDLALQQRDESERRLREFAADASHELRTPLAVARSHAELLREYMLLTDLPEQVHLSLTRIGEETGRMAGIVDDLLLLARLDDAGSAMQDEVDLTRVVVDAVDDARITSPGHRWSIDVPAEPVVIRADTEQVRRMVTNLVTNVRLHTPVGTTARCELLASASEIVITVHDTGPGFPPELIDHAHDRFARGRHRESSADSTGLGLAIVHAVAHAQGGSMAIVSTPGDTTVMVTLPLAHAT
ncbi:sensor histidine kinase [Rudaeicoccus suwonensis]|uniref:histidine kinase n=1 Tax=Rudaeicoccus suwonensis TaxID=657409 RepID=A0A561E0U5_9MICO|nr:HAMP domain-containing sensor histidine kinase [Rudaeicoccus suwonensis]TWE09255.1 two-component system OmpR family sensor kinase [Rudaeicoccus suwonensis]